MQRDISEDLEKLSFQSNPTTPCNDITINFNELKLELESNDDSHIYNAVSTLQTALSCMFSHGTVENDAND